MGGKYAKPCLHRGPQETPFPEGPDLEPDGVGGGVGKHYPACAPAWRIAPVCPAVLDSSKRPNKPGCHRLERKPFRPCYEPGTVGNVIRKKIFSPPSLPKIDLGKIFLPFPKIDLGRDGGGGGGWVGPKAECRRGCW